MQLSEMETEDGLSWGELLDAWDVLSVEERMEGFRLLPRPQREDLFLSLSAHDMARLLVELPQDEWRSWIRILAPDDAADLLQNVEDEELRERLLGLLDDATRTEVRALMAYKDDEAGGLMNPRFVRVRPDMTVDEAIRYLRRQASQKNELIYYAYILDAGQKLLGVASFRDLFLADPAKSVRDMMRTELITLTEDLDQSEVSRIFGQHALLALPVLDHEGRMKGIITADDVVEVVQEEATEDLHKIAAVEAFQEPYLSVSLLELVRRRGVWLACLFIGEMFTATAMGFYEGELKKALVLTLFIPLIISSGGNSGSQASTLVVRAMALGQVRMRDWWRIFYREILVGAGLGLILGTLGLLRILVWPARNQQYGEHYLLISFTIGCTLIGVVVFGSLVGAMLPFILRLFRLDPATASAPFVATMVDVSGLIIYFSVASLILRGTLL